MNYSHFCKHCGEAFFSNDKAEIRSLRKKHNSVPCPLTDSSKGCIARPWLAKQRIMHGTVTSDYHYGKFDKSPEVQGLFDAVGV